MRRRRACGACDQRYTTYERAEGLLLSVLKRDGSVERFDRDKVVAGITSAAKNRPVDAVQVESLVGSIEDALDGRVEPIPTSEIGGMVLAGLRSLDEIAYLRFASVYKEFDDARDFARELEALGASPGHVDAGS